MVKAKAKAKGKARAKAKPNAEAPAEEAMVKAKAKAKGKARANAKGKAQATAKADDDLYWEARREEARREENERYDQLFGETRLYAATRGASTLPIDDDGVVISSLLEAKAFTDWLRSFPRCDIDSLPRDERLMRRRLCAWGEACRNKYPMIDTMYAADKNSRDRAYLQAGGVTFEPSPAAPMPMPEYSNASNTTQ
jgi:hypothetical protein